MFEIVTQGAALLETLKKAAELSRKANNIELQTALMDLREGIQQLREEVSKLRAENDALREQAQIREELKWDGMLYWREPKDGPKDGPYCPKCYEGDNRLARMRIEVGERSAVRCNVCGRFDYTSSSATSDPYASFRRF